MVEVGLRRDVQRGKAGNLKKCHREKRDQNKERCEFIQQKFIEHLLCICKWESNSVPDQNNPWTIKQV